MKETGRLF